MSEYQEKRNSLRQKIADKLEAVFDDHSEKESESVLNYIMMHIDKYGMYLEERQRDLGEGSGGSSAQMDAAYGG